MPGGISWRDKKKRDQFIEEAIKAIQEVNKRLGYSMTSKETLSLMVQRYIAIHKPPRFPIKRKKSKLTLISGEKDE